MTKPFKTITRYAITKVNRDGMRCLATANQGRCFQDSRKAAEAYLKAVLSNNSEDTLRSVYGDLSKMEVRPVECYENGDAVGIYFEL